MAALDREDIEKLSDALYKIPKLADKFGERLRTSPEFVRQIDFSVQLGLLRQAVEVVVKLVQSCKPEMKLEQIRMLNEKLQIIEGQADKAILVLYRDLYSGKYEAIQVLALKDLYELLEKIIDRCRDTGNIVAHVALKHA
jgi:uncharacterized protein